MTRLRYSPALAAMGRRIAGSADPVSPAGGPLLRSSPALAPFDSATGAADSVPEPCRQTSHASTARTPSAPPTLGAEGDAITVTLSPTVMMILRLAEAELGVSPAEIVSRGICMVAAGRMPELARNPFNDEFARPTPTPALRTDRPAGGPLLRSSPASSPSDSATGAVDRAAARPGSKPLNGGDRQRARPSSQVRAPP